MVFLNESNVVNVQFEKVILEVSNYNGYNIQVRSVLGSPATDKL